MSVSTARDLIAMAGFACVFAGVWLVAGIGTALICAGVVLTAVGVAADVRGGRA